MNTRYTSVQYNNILHVHFHNTCNWVDSENNNYYCIVAGTIDTLPSGQCVSLFFELISMAHQLQIDEVH